MPLNQECRINETQRHQSNIVVSIKILIIYPMGLGSIIKSFDRDPYPT